MTNITTLEELIAKSGATKYEDLETIWNIYGNWSNLLKGKKPGVVLKNGLSYRFPTLIQKYKKGKAFFLVRTKQDKAETIPSVYEIFQKEEYKWLNVKGKTVIDIGANIGDTAIYFALNGAQRVYGFEPFPYAYSKAKANIKLNKLGKKVTLLNKAVEGENGYIKLSTEKSWGGSTLEQAKNGKEIKITTLHDIIKKYKLYGAELKIDAEGAEYPIILGTSDKDLQLFDHIMLEYHHGYLDLEKKLVGAGFDVKHTLPRTVSWNKNVRMGLLMATNLTSSNFKNWLASSAAYINNPILSQISSKKI